MRPTAIIYSDGYSIKEWKNSTSFIIVGNAFISGYINGNTTYARLNRCSSIAELNNTQRIIADTDNHCLRLLDMEEEQLTDYLGSCTSPGSIPEILGRNEVKMRSPVGLVKDVRDKTMIYISQKYSIWRLNTATLEVITIYRDVNNLKSGLEYGPLVWHDRTLLVPADDIILSFQIPAERTYPSRIQYSYTNKLEWIDNSNSYRQFKADLPVYRGITSIGVHGVFIAADQRNSVINLLDLDNNIISAMCSNTTENDFSTCMISSPNTIFFDKNLSRLFIGHSGKISILEGAYYKVTLINLIISLPCAGTPAYVH